MMLKISNLAVDHGKLRAIWDLSLDVDKGARVGLLGANGAGKSTTLGAILGIYPPAEGEILYRDNSIMGASPARNVEAGIALVPEGRRLFGEMTVRENLEMGAYTKSARTKVTDGIDHAFTLFPILKEKSGDLAGTLSGGQQQMLAISRALMSAPDLLLLDEPFLGVAPILVDEVMEALRQISSEGMTMLLVEQNIHRALDFVEHAYVIENGRTVLDGAKDTLLNDPGFSNKFLGLE
jgi:branched-chain amino acid transport system ATP-binding protein